MKHFSRFVRVFAYICVCACLFFAIILVVSAFLVVARLYFVVDGAQADSTANSWLSLLKGMQATLKTKSFSQVTCDVARRGARLVGIAFIAALYPNPADRTHYSNADERILLGHLPRLW